jgi:coenzyme F420-0:L-glutamate ligase / coenzyme F420-1:gamma-L-glutamate ligase
MGIRLASQRRNGSSRLMPKSSGLTPSTGLQAIPVWGIGEVASGDSIADLVIDALALGGMRFHEGDVLVVKHKIVSKAEGRTVDLSSVKPSVAAKRFAAKNGTDPRLIELALREAKRVVRKQHVLITETAHGFVCANSGIDVSNVDGGNTALLLPLDPDRSAANIMRRIKKRTRLHIPIIIADSFGRAWREGLNEVAIGLAGMAPMHDYRGRRDPYGYKLHATEECVADELACVAGLVCGKNNSVPACIIRGYRYQRRNGSAHQIVRPAERDLFR